MILKFTVPGLPRPKERPRFGKHGNVYTPKATKAYEQEIWAMALSAGARQDCFRGCYVAVSMIAYFDAQAEFDRVDADNIGKICLDGLKPAFNDNKVTRLLIVKEIESPARLFVEVRDE